MATTPSLIILWVLSALAQFCGGFCTIAVGSSQIRCDYQLTAKQEKQDEASTELENNGEPISAWKRSRRRVDYPSFAYDTGFRSSKSKSKASFRVSSTTDKDTSSSERSTEAQPRSVSIPGGKPKKRNKFSLRDIIEYLAASNSAYDYEISVVSDSAKKTRLLNDRAYARKEAFAGANIADPPNLADLAPPVPMMSEIVWISSPFRVATFALASLSLPFLTKFLERFAVTMPPDLLDEIISKFSPGVSILYGTFVSLTLGILYRRKDEIQNSVAMESSMLTVILRNLLNIFRHDKELAIEAGQCTADQIRTLVRGSRGGELLMLMYADPYARMAELIDFFEERAIEKGNSDIGGKAGLIGYSRDVLKDLNKLRAGRLSQEALALPPTHFVILTVLTILILFGYVVSILPTVDASGTPSRETCLLFGALCTVYVLFYNFAQDLNDPFQGVYQIRRSATASHLLEAKWLIAHHPLLRGEVDFEDIESDELVIRSPGLGDLRFERAEILPDSGSPDKNSPDNM